MAQPYVGEIRIFAGNFAPAGWMFCSGQLLPISENETLFQLIGTTYGGDGQSTFALPDMRGRIPVHQGQIAGQPNLILAETGGAEEVTLSLQQIAAHNHVVHAAVPVNASATAVNATSPSPVGSRPALGTSKIYAAATVTPTVVMNNMVITGTGANQPHNNLMPYLCVNYIISLFGIFPSPT